MLTRYTRNLTSKVDPDDQVLIRGIICGEKYGKYVVQLVEPDFVLPSNGTIKNGQRIHVSENFLKRIPAQHTIDEASLRPSLTDCLSNGSISNQSPPPIVSNIELKTDNIDDNNTLTVKEQPLERYSAKKEFLTERSLIEEWDNILGEADVNSMADDSAETCDAWTLNDCDPCKRILFCLSYYKLWIAFKAGGNEMKIQINKNILKDHLADFMYELRSYSAVQMMNDFHHIKQFHINNATHNNHSTSAEDKQDVFEFFKKGMGFCNHNNCRSYTRNNRDRNECTESDKLRKDMYFIDGAKVKEQSAEITETNVQQMFDMIHCTLLHPSNSTTGTNSGSSKFITEIEGNNETKKDDKKEKESTTKSELDQDKFKTSSYGFGEQFKYHQKNHKNYIKAKYTNLKEEILCNKLYTISEFDFDSLSHKSEDYLNSYRGKSLKARKQAGLNAECHIIPNSQIRLDHIIALMLYTNMDDLQRAFKKGCRFLNDDNEDVNKVKMRNCEIAIWCKLLWESITFFGESISKKQVFYHGLNCKLLFGSVIAAFNCPTSTTVNKSVAYNFSTDNGIIVQLSQYESLDSHYLDVSDLSDYPNEQERLFFQAQLGFQDIIYNNTSNKYYIKCLSLFQNITKGNFFTHNTKIFKNKHQKTLIKMMDTARENLEVKDNDHLPSTEFVNASTSMIENDEIVQKKKKKKKTPKYMQDLFEHYFQSEVKTFGNIIWLNKEEFSKLNEDVRKYIGDEEDANSFISWLGKKYKTQVKYTKTVSYVVKNHEDDDEKTNHLNQFWDGKSLILPFVFCQVKDDVAKRSERLRIKLKLKKAATKTDTTATLMVKILIKEMPYYCKSVKCSIGIFCPQINFTYTTAMTLTNKLGGIPLCESVKLEGLDAFEWKIFFKFISRVDQNNVIRPL